MVPDVAPGDSMGVQSDAQAAGPELPHVSVATAFTPAVPGVQLVQVEAAFPETVPAGQSMQTKAAVPENLPAAQAEQVLAPTESENVPAVQSVHLGVTLHAAVKPVSEMEASELNHILREPVVEL
jgi:hypothetical protein